MEKHKIKTINELANICTSKNSESLKKDICEFIDVVTSARELSKLMSGSYPKEIVKSLEIIFDGKTGIKTLEIDDQVIIERNDNPEGENNK